MKNSKFDELYKSLLTENTWNNNVIQEGWFSSSDDDEEKQNNDEDDTEAQEKKAEEEANKKGEWNKELADKYAKKVIGDSKHYKEIIEKTNKFTDDFKLKGQKFPSELWDGRVAPVIRESSIKGKPLIFNVKTKKNPDADYYINEEKKGNELLKAFGFSSNKDLFGVDSKTNAGKNKKEKAKLADKDKIESFLKKAKECFKALKILQKDGDFTEQVQAIVKVFSEKFAATFKGTVLSENMYNTLFDAGSDLKVEGLWGDDKDAFKKWLNDHGGVKLSMHVKDDEGAGQAFARFLGF